ncbi:MAG: type II toxin-antitoxin system HicB family antitoxin [Anaerolineales bacterium]|nr:type II toxin-antitoxin system HicB family antitoxin [Anaerolineales bacterium]
MTREFSVIVERDSEGWYVASVPELSGCHTQAKSLDKLMERIREAIELCLEVEQEVPPQQFIGVQRIAQSSPPDRTASHCRLETGWF